jgi:hypothetical protein
MSEGVIGRDHVNALSLAHVAATESVNLGAVAAVLEFWNTHDIDGVLSSTTLKSSGTTWRWRRTMPGLAAVRGFLHELFTAWFQDQGTTDSAHERVATNLKWPPGCCG